MTPPRPFRRLRAASRPVVMTAVLAPCGLALVLGACKHEAPPGERPPVALIGSWSAYPPVSVDLPVAVPLAPLLAGDEPDRLAMTEPRGEVSSLRPGHALLVRFNRPMVEAGRLNTPLADPVLRFSPSVAGKQRWIKRNVIEFVAEKEAWSRSHTVKMTLDEGLRSVAGESPGAPEHSIVFDTSPRMVRGPRAGRVPPGESFQVVFEGKVDAGAMASEMMMYEVDGGRRSIPFKLSERKRDEDGHVPIDVSPGLKLEPGGQMALALAPRLGRGGGSSPEVIEMEITPRPHIEGIDCQVNASETSQCEFSGPPGRVVELDEGLRLLATGPLADLPKDAVDVTPKVTGLKVTREGERIVVIRADWDPAQTYQVTLHELRDREGHTLGKLAPLAVRSSGRPAAVRFDAGRWVLEKDAPTELRIDAIHVEQGEVRAASVAPGNELMAALSPASLLPDGEPAKWTRLGLPSLVPDARANRWGRGIFDWQKNDTTRSSMVVVQAIPDSKKVEAKPPTALMQQTDLGVSARVLPSGVSVWVTSIASARPVGDAEVTVGDGDGHEAKAKTAADGTAWVPWSLADGTQSLAVRAVAGGDRAVLFVDPRTAMGPRHLNLAAGELGASDEGLSTSLFTERGVYRAGETVRAKAVLRVGAATERKAYQGPVQFRLFDPTERAHPVAMRSVTTSAFGGAAVELKLDEHLEAGTYRLEVGENDPTVAPFASITVQVRDYRPPPLRVDVSSEQPGAVEGETVSTLVSARYPFGSAAAGAAVTWSWTRSPDASTPDGWSGFTFQGADVSGRAGTVSQGQSVIDEAGKATIATKVVMSAAARERAALEVSVRDASGRTTAARQTFVTYPAENEIGVREVPRWMAAGSSLDVEAIVVDHGGKAVEGRDVQCQIWREGWQAWWQRSRSHHDDDDASDEGGEYQARRAQEKKLSHRCKLTSGGAPVHCAWTPDRPGSYVLEATTRDSKGHTAVASTRVYVAGPDEHPDRDAPGTAVTLTQTQESWKVGDTAQVAFESPFPDAEVLFQVERGRVLHTERRRVSAGGQVFSFPVTADMMPGAHASVSVVRPRTGPPGAKLDLDSPDLRVGMTEISVTPSVGPLTVSVTMPGAEAVAGTKVPIALRVTDAQVRGVPSEVALFVVDEGTLRLTGYKTPQLADDMFAHKNPWFAWEDMRRSLASRIVPALLPGAGGDGGGGEAMQKVADDRDRFDPTPLWLPSLRTNEQGEVKATLPLPRRPADYRVMAVAIDRGVRTGVAQASLVATRPLLLRPSLPRFVVEGDRFEATAFVHSTRAAATDVTARVTVGGESTPPTSLHFEAAGEQRVTRSIEARRAGDMVIRFEVSAQGDSDQIEQTVHVLPRSRALHSEAVGSVEKKREFAVAFPGAPAGETPGVAGDMMLTIASHPFVGFAMDIDAIAASPFDGPESQASTLLGLASYRSLQTGRRATDASDAELGARAARAIARLVSLQTSDGGFGAHDRSSRADEYLTAHVLHALTTAQDAGWTVPARAREQAVAWLTVHVLRELTSLESDASGRDTLALALRALAAANAPSVDRTKALYDQRERLSPYGLAQLALAMEDGDLRRDELVADATRRVLATGDTAKSDQRVLPWYDSSPRTYGAVLEAVARSSSPTASVPSQKLAALLLAQRAEASERGDWSSHEVSATLTGLAAYARRFVPTTCGPMTVRLDGQPIAPAEHDRDTVWYAVHTTTPGAPHRLSIESADPVYFALSSRWTVPLGEVDREARGKSAALHRVLETEAGEPLADGAHVKLGSLVRVRLFVYSEANMPSSVLLRDRGAGGFEVIDAGADTTPQDSLQALLRMGPDDEVSEASGHYAQRSLSAIEQRGFSEHESLFFLGSHSGPRSYSGGSGLREFTYGVRAATVGTFLFPPASLEAEAAPSFTARSTMTTLTVDP